MNAMEQVRENLAAAAQGLPNSLSPGELAVVEKMRDTFASRREDPVHRLPLLTNAPAPLSASLAGRGPVWAWASGAVGGNARPA
jgi:hypothetical protein